MTLLDEILPAQTVAVFFLHGTGLQKGIIFFQPEILDDASGIDHGRHSPFLIAGTAADDDLVVFESLVGFRSQLSTLPTPTVSI